MDESKGKHTTRVNTNPKKKHFIIKVITIELNRYF